MPLIQFNWASPGALFCVCVENGGSEMRVISKPIWVMAALLLGFGASAQIVETEAVQLAQEWKQLVTEGTGVINDMQPQINAGKVTEAQAKPDALVAQFQARYAKNTGRQLDTQGAGPVVDLRKAYIKAFRDILQAKQAVLLKGGQDSLVPAHFRALVLADLNKAMKGRLQGYATNRDRELINGDWAVSRVMKGSALAPEVQKLVDRGAMEPVTKRQGNALLGYWPMTLQPACVACHDQNGLKQEVGQFGGALVAEIVTR
jgi:hypothetical protein